MRACIASSVTGMSNAGAKAKKKADKAATAAAAKQAAIASTIYYLCRACMVPNEFFSRACIHCGYDRAPLLPTEPTGVPFADVLRFAQSANRRSEASAAAKTQWLAELVHYA
jgi:hypothetical protein